MTTPIALDDRSHPVTQIPLSEAELTRLICLSTSNKALQLSFGPGWAALRVTEESKWALPLLAEWRGVNEKGVTP